MHLSELEKLFKALGNKKRLEIVKLLLENGEMSVGEISEKLDLPLKTASRNLRMLYNAGLLTVKTKKGYVFYSYRPKQAPIIKELPVLLKEHKAPSKKLLSYQEAQLLHPQIKQTFKKLIEEKPKN